MTTLNSAETAQNLDQDFNSNGTATDLGNDGAYVEVESFTLSADDISTDSDENGGSETVASAKAALKSRNPQSHVLRSATRLANRSATRLATALPKSSGKRAFGIANRMAAAKTLENLYQITVTLEFRQIILKERSLTAQG